MIPSLDFFNHFNNTPSDNNCCFDELLEFEHFDERNNVDGLNNTPPNLNEQTPNSNTNSYEEGYNFTTNNNNRMMKNIAYQNNNIQTMNCHGNNLNVVTPQLSMIEKSEYACLSCRQLHRKCDKTLPSCSYCLKRGYECKYEKPKRNQKPVVNQQKFVFVNDGNKSNQKDQYGMSARGSNSDRVSVNDSINTMNTMNSIQILSRTANRRVTEPYNVNNVNRNNLNRIVNSNVGSNGIVQNELNYRFVTTQTLDIYFDVIACGMPLVQRKKMEQILEYQSNLYHSSFSTSGCDFYTNQYEFEKDQSLLFTLQALCLQQMGHREVSTQLFHQGKQLLGKYFDEIDSMSVLLSMKFTALYLLGEGERNKARVMMSTVKAGIEPYLKKNEKLKEINDLDFVLKNAKSITSLMIEAQLKLVDFYLYEDLFPDTYLFEAVEEISKRKMKFTQEERAKGCKKLDRTTYDKLISIMMAFVCLTNIFVESERNENVDNLIMLALLLTIKQIWLEILINADESFRDLDEILRVSSDIIALTRTKFFPYLQINATQGIILAATLRANYYFKLGPNDNINDDLRALRSLSKKYKYIQTECVDLIKALETLTYMTNSNMGNPFSVDEIFNFTSQIERESSSSSHIEGGLEGCYHEYVKNHRPVLNKVMEDCDALDELVNCLMDQDKIKKKILDPLQKIESLHQRKLQLVKYFRDKAIDKKDIYDVMETELMQHQLLHELELEKSKLLNQNNNR